MKVFPNLMKQTCEFAKHTRTSYPSNNNRNTTPFMIVHSDVWGLSRVVYLVGYRWFVTFIDCYTQVTWVYLLHNKDELFTYFKNFHKLVNTRFDAKIKVFRTDNGIEYFKGECGAYLTEHEILHQSSCVDTPEQNGVAESKNRHLIEVARSLMFTMGVPLSFWGDVILTAAYLINRMTSRVLDFAICIGLLQGLVSLYFIPPKVFSCVCFVHDYRNSRGKLDPTTLRCFFIGYFAT